MRKSIHVVVVVGVLGVAVFSAGASRDDGLVAGATFRVYRVDEDLHRVPAMAENQTPNVDVLIGEVDLVDADFRLPAPIVTSVDGLLEVRVGGAYRFRLTSDDGARLVVGGRLVIDHDGRHGATAAESGVVELEPGRHPFGISHFDSGGARRLLLEWREPDGGAFVVIPRAAMLTEDDLTRVTSGGLKRVADARPAGDGKPVAGVHPGWRVDTIRPAGFEPMVGAMCFDSHEGRDRLIVGTFFPLQRDDRSLPDIDSKEPDRLFALTGVTVGDNPEADPALIEARVVCDGLFEPAGLCRVGSDLYVSQRRSIVRLRDVDGDGYYESHVPVGAGWEGWNYHQFCFGLKHWDPDGDENTDGGLDHPGYLYAALSTAMAPPGWEGQGTNATVNGPMRGGFIEVDLSSGDARVIAGGARTPNGLTLGPSSGGRPGLFYSDNQGTWMPTSQFSEVVAGRFYGHYNRTNLVPRLAERFPAGGHASVFCERERTAPALWMEQNAVSNSPTEGVLFEDRGPGQVLIGELTAGGVRRAVLERVNGQWQGSLHRFTQGLEVGVNRMCWGPDGALYVGGIGGNGNWNWKDTRFGLQRLQRTGGRVFEIESVGVRAGGLRVTFNAEVGGGALAEAAGYEVRQWAYRPTAEYGGPKVDAEVLEVVSARPVFGSRLSDGVRAVDLELPGLKEGRLVHIRCSGESADGSSLWSPEAWYTLNRRPSRAARRDAVGATIGGEGCVGMDHGVGVGVLPPAGGVPLVTGNSMPTFGVDGKTLDSRRPGRGQDELIAAPGFVEVGAGSGDMETRTLFGDCRLHVEWFAPAGASGQSGGNSGVYIHDLYEIQILGTPAGEGPPEPNEAGSIYRVKAADRNASTGPGTWQAYDIWFRSARFADGVKVEDARVTMFWNGVLVHDDVAIGGGTGSRSGRAEPGERGEIGADGVQVGPLRLQDHTSAAEGAVRFRNVWIEAIDGARWEAGEWLDVGAGETLGGWRRVGGRGTYRVEAGAGGAEIVGTAVTGGPNTFLVLEREFGDFEMLVEVRQHAELNSGIQIRSHVAGKPGLAGLADRSGRLTGKQIEMDPSARAYTGGVYDEGRRGWLHPLVDAPYARRAYRVGEWNRLRIVAQGPVIRTWVNGVPAAAVFDAVTPSGFIGLQVHGIGDRVPDEPMEVSWRGIRIRELRRLSR